jgi:hypothetical protein
MTLSGNGHEETETSHGRDDHPNAISFLAWRHLIPSRKSPDLTACAVMKVYPSKSVLVHSAFMVVWQMSSSCSRGSGIITKLANA